MTVAMTKGGGVEASAQLADESFMSADDLRTYMSEMEMARAAKSNDRLDLADKARDDLIKRLSKPMDLTPEAMRDIGRNLQAKLKAAAERGQTELMVMRFPTALCTDKGRAINNADADWPETLIGRPRQAFEFWRDQLQPVGFRLSAMVVEWPGGLPGDIGFFLKWGGSKK